MLDVKLLERDDEHGLEQWRPVPDAAFSGFDRRGRGRARFLEQVPDPGRAEAVFAAHGEGILAVLDAYGPVVA